MARTIAIWFFGLLGFGMIGLIFGSLLDRSPYDSGNGFFGFLAGVALFSCLRLWLSTSSKKSE